MMRTVALSAIGLAILTVAPAEGQGLFDKSGNGTRKTNITVTVNFPGVVLKAYWVDTAGKEQEKYQIGAPIGTDTEAFSFVTVIRTQDTHVWRFKIDGQTFLNLRADANSNQTVGLYLDPRDSRSWELKNCELRDGQVVSNGVARQPLSEAQFAELRRRTKGS